MSEKARRVLILCANPASIEAAKENYKPEKGDEEHYFFNFSEAVAWLLVENAVGSPPDLVVFDLEDKKCRGHLFFLKTKTIAPNALAMGFNPSQKNKP